MKRLHFLGKTLLTVGLCASFCTISQGSIPNIDSAKDYYGHPALAEVPSQMAEALEGNLLAAFALPDQLIYAVTEGENGQESHILYEGMEDGATYYGIFSSAQGNMDAETLGEQMVLYQNTPNIHLDYALLPYYSEEEEFTKHLETALTNTVGQDLNWASLDSIAQYMEVVLQQMGTVEVYAKQNILFLEGEDMTIQRQNSQEIAFLNLLQEKNINLSRSVEKNLQVVVQQMDSSEVMQFTLNKSILMVLEPEMNLRIQVAESQIALELSYELLLNSFLQGNQLSIMVVELENQTYAVHFFDDKGNLMEALSQPITLTLPAYSSFDEFKVLFRGETWGGQWDENNLSISLLTPYTGEYQLVKATETILDLEESSEIQAEALSFLVKKGFFTLELGKSNPTEGLTRNSLSVALVRMLYALDRDASTTFEDLTTESFYHVYIASAQGKNLFSSGEDKLFLGEEIITQEELFVLLAQILVEERGYSYPQDSFLDFSGVEKWSDAGKEAAALCYQQGILRSGEQISPQEDMTRGQAAVYLYRLFQKLYPNSPVSTLYSQSTPPQAVDMEETALITVAVFVAWTLFWCIFAVIDYGLRKAGWKRKQKKKLKKEMKSQAKQEAKEERKKGKNTAKEEGA